jgi:hypothetical protein
MNTIIDGSSKKLADNGIFAKLNAIDAMKGAVYKGLLIFQPGTKSPIKK